MKPQVVSARQFDGTTLCLERLRDWISEHDIEDTDLSVQGDSEPLALDLITEGRIYVIERGEWLVIKDGELYPESEEAFEAGYELHE